MLVELAVLVCIEVLENACTALFLSCALLVLASTLTLALLSIHTLALAVLVLTTTRRSLFTLALLAALEFLALVLRPTTSEFFILLTLTTHFFFRPLRLAFTT
ncbi:MAG: hypothetical protein COA70_05170 [Planctomycetota bacterium]|nr:MAG: hypothetical protein COA70_05170 [Planctomycetota bacterium]